MHARSEEFAAPGRRGPRGVRRRARARGRRARERRRAGGAAARRGGVLLAVKTADGAAQELPRRSRRPPDAAGSPPRGRSPLSRSPLRDSVCVGRSSSATGADGPRRWGWPRRRSGVATRRRRRSRAGEAGAPVSSPPWEPAHDARHRRHQPEGRRRQDDHGDQPGRLPGRGRRAGAARRPRPAGERVGGARGPRTRDPASRRTVCWPAMRRSREAVVPTAVRGSGPAAGLRRPRRRRRRARRRRRRRLRPRAGARRAARRLPVRLHRLPAVARRPHRQRPHRGARGAHPGAGRVLRARGARAAPRHRQPGARAPQPRPPDPRRARDDARRPHAHRSRGRGRGARAPAHTRLRRRRPPQRAPRGGAQPRSADLAL